MFTIFHSDFIGNPGNCSYPQNVKTAAVSSTFEI